MANIISIYDDLKDINIMYLVFKNAFNKVPHKKRLNQVRAVGVGGRVANWLEHWLTGRRQ